MEPEFRSYLLKAHRLAVGLLITAGCLFFNFAHAARFANSQSSLDGGGGSAASGRFVSESSMGPLSGTSASSDGAIALGTGYASLLNNPPSPEKDFLELPATGPVNISVASLLANDLDLEGDSSTFSLLQTTTANGGTVTLSGGIITYTPPARPDPRGDSFSYVLTDSFGVKSIGTANLVSPAAAPRLTSFQGNRTNITVRFNGLPNASYLLQFRPNFGSGAFWKDFPNPTQPLLQRADASGDFLFTIPVGMGLGFFRAADAGSLSNQLSILRTGMQLSTTLRGVPNTVYKLQFRSAFEPSDPWRDFPSPDQPYTVRAASDGFYQISAPITGTGQNGFFRTVARTE